MKFTRIQFKRKPKPTQRDLAQIQAETLANLGADLRQIRQERSLSLEEIARHTLIPARLLYAIEEGNLDKLPEPVYVRGFLRRFADCLGLDGLNYAQKFPVGNGLPKRTDNWFELPFLQLRPLHLYALYISLVVFAVRGLSYSVNQSIPSPDVVPEPAPVADSNDSEKTATSEVETQAPTQVSPPETTPPKIQANANPQQNADPQQPVRVGLTLTDRSWIRVESDGETAFEGMLSEGTHSWTAKEKLTVIAGNAGGVMIAFNGDEAEPMGEPGSVEELTFVADSRGASPSPSATSTPANGGTVQPIAPN